MRNPKPLSSRRAKPESASNRRVDKVVYLLHPKGKQWHPAFESSHPMVWQLSERIFRSRYSAMIWLKSCGPDVEVAFEPVAVQMISIGE